MSAFSLSIYPSRICLRIILCQSLFIYLSQAKTCMSSTDRIGVVERLRNEKIIPRFFYVAGSGNDFSAEIRL